MIFYSLYYFLFFHFILLHTRVLYPPSFIYFSPPEPSSNISFALLSSSKKKICSSHQRKERDRDRERRERLGEIGLGLHHMHLHCRSNISTARLGQIGLFFFSYLLVLIQIYFKNWILFCGLCFVFGLVLLLMNRSLSFLFFSSHFIWFMRKKEATATERMRE